MRLPQEFRVLVKVRGTKTRLATCGELPGFAIDPFFVPEPIRLDDGVCGDIGFCVRGTACKETLELLRRHPDVLEVYVDTEVVPFPITLDHIRDWPLRRLTAPRSEKLRSADDSLHSLPE